MEKINKIIGKFEREKISRVKLYHLYMEYIIIRKFVVCIALLPYWCSAMTDEVTIIGGPEKIDAVLETAIEINGHITSLREIYGNVDITADNFKPGITLSLALKTPRTLISIDRQDHHPVKFGEPYVERIFLHHPLSIIPPDVKDSPTFIAENLAKSKMIHAQPLTLIIGDAQTGKTTALEQIRTELTRLIPTTWTVFVDLWSLVSWELLVSSLTIDSVIERHIPIRFRPLFRNVLELNPRKINFIFDNVDKMTVQNERAARAASLIKNLVDKGTTVIATGRKYNIDFLRKQKINIALYEIPEMNIIESENMLKNVWKKYIDLKLLDTPSSSGSLGKIDVRLNGYVLAFTHALYKTPIPRTPVTLIVLAEHFQDKMYMYPGEYNFPVSCLDYVLSEESFSPMLLSGIEHTKINKVYLYHEFVKGMEMEIGDPVYSYGAIATKQLVDGDRLSAIAPWYELHIDAGDMHESLIAFKERAYFTNAIGYHIEFINPEYQYFFAAGYLIKFLFMDNIPEDRELLHKIVIEPYYHKVLEFLAPAADVLTFEELDNILFHNHRLIHKILDNIISNGYGEFLLRIIDKLLAENKLSELHNYFQTGRTIKYGPKRVLGIISSTEIPQKSGTPLELLIVNDLFGVLNTMYENKVQISCNENWQKLLRIAVTAPIPNMDGIQFIIGSLLPYHIVIDYNNLLYHAINDVGVAGQPVASYLVRRGAKPTKTTLNGRTLLHAAVQWNSVELLRFVVEELQVSAIDTLDDLGRSVFMTALDANPSPFHTAPGWWKTMEYLVQKIDPLLLPINKEIHEKSFTIPKEDVQSPWLKFILSADFIELTSTNTDVRVLKCYPAQADDVNLKRLATITNFIPSHSWKLNLKTLELRRYFSLQKLYRGGPGITLIEVLATYRGSGSLSVEERKHYETTMQLLDQRYGGHLTTASKARIIQTLVYNVYSTRNYADLKYLKNNDHFLSLSDRQQAHLLDSLFQFLKYPNYNELPEASISLHTRLLSKFDEFQQVGDYLQIRENDLNYNRMGKFSSVDSDGFRSSSEFDIDPGCLSESSSRRGSRSTKMNCLYTWDDVDEFNDATQRRTTALIQINSDRFLAALAAIEYNNPEKVKQLVYFVKYLENGAHVRDPFSGESKMLLRNVLYAESLRTYRDNQRIKNTINDVWQPSSFTGSKLSFRVASRSAALYLAGGIPFVRAIYGTIIACFQNNDTNRKNCLYATSALALSAMLIPVSIAAVKYTPRLIAWGTSEALNYLPSSMPSIIGRNLKYLRIRGLQYGGKTAAVAIGVLAMGFDIYNIVQMSNMIDQCNRNGSNCNSKDQIDYIISLSFSCVSIVTAAGLIIGGAGLAIGVLTGLAILTLELFASGLNDIIFYNNRYDTTFKENFRIFFHKISFNPPPEDIQRLIRRTGWINALEKHAHQVLGKSNNNIVAYAVGIGTITSNSVLAGYSEINMKYSNVTTTERLSRVLPTGNFAIPLCLPKQDLHEVYETIPKNVSSAVYECQNSFVIAHKQRWKNKTSSTSYLMYDLRYIDRGIIQGSNLINNLFLIYNGTSKLEIYGGAKNVSNIYMILEDTFNGTIVFDNESRENLLDLSAIHSDLVSFRSDVSLRNARVFMGRNSFELLTYSNVTLTNVRVIGRAKKPDSFLCYYSNALPYNNFHQPISVDSGGGESLSHMDIVDDCKISVLRPFTCVTGSNNTKLTYIVYIMLDRNLSSNVDNKFKLSRIRPKESKFIVTFVNRPIYASGYSVQYVRSNGTLRWRFHYQGSSIMLLAIEPYRRLKSPHQENNTDGWSIETINCIFVDSFSGTTISPEIQLPTDNTDVIDVKHFNIFTTVNSSRFEDIRKRSYQIRTARGEDLIIRKKLTHDKSGQTYIFGSRINDRFYIDSMTTYVRGDDGYDIYVLNSNSPKQIWVDNQADDGAMDTLIIPDTTCDFLEATIGSITTDFCNGTPEDITLSCFLRANAETPYINVVLKNYFLDSDSRHLQVYWRGNTYIPISMDWLETSRNNNDSAPNQVIKLALFFSFTEDWNSTTLAITSDDTYVVFNVTDVTNPLVAYRSKNSRDVILVRQYLYKKSASLVVLQNFFSNNNLNNISIDWFYTKIICIDETNHYDDNPKILDAMGIHKLYINSLTNNTTSMDGNSDFIQEYIVDMSETMKKNHTIIQHNNDKSSRDNKLGILIVMGANPGDFIAKWNYRMRFLQLCTNHLCISIYKWCDSARHRLYRIEFVQSLAYEPIIINNFDKTECPKVINGTYTEFIQKMNEKLLDAQALLLLRNWNSDTDYSRFLQCVGTIFADIVAHKSMYRLFGFESIVEQTEFMRYNCKILMTELNLKGLSLENMKTIINNKIKQLQLSAPILLDDLKESISRINNCLQSLGGRWQQFKAFLIHYDNTAATYQILDNSSFILDICR